MFAIKINQFYFVFAIGLLFFELFLLLLQHLADLQWALGLSVLVVGIVVIQKLDLLPYQVHLRLNSLRLALFARGMPP